MVHEAIKALERAGMSLGRETLAAVLPELSESVNVAGLRRERASSFASDSPDTSSDLLDDLESRVVQDRLAHVRAAIDAIDSRSGHSP